MRISDWSSDVCSSDLTAEELERSNRRLSGEESYTVAPSRYLGHYVAGQLAARLGVTVRLQDNPAGGLLATLVVPPTLLEVPADAARDRTSVLWGKRGSVRGGSGGRATIKQKKP